MRVLKLAVKKLTHIVSSSTLLIVNWNWGCDKKPFRLEKYFLRSGNGTRSFMLTSNMKHNAID